MQGRGVDAPLNDVGKEQANKTFEHLKHEIFDHVFTSSLVRTHQTVAQFIESGLPSSSLADLDEISWGKMEGIKATREDKNLYAETIKNWRKGELSKAVGQGETPLQVMIRQKKAVDVLLQQDAEKLLVCMHGRAMRILLCWMLNYPLNYMDGFPHQNCAYYKLIYRKNTFFIDEFNVNGHLN